MSDLLAALCLVAVLEGLMLFAMPGQWKKAMAHLLGQSEHHLRLLGGLLLLLGLLALFLIRAG